MTRSIRFVRPWMGRGVGQLDSRLNPGVMTMLVSMGVAEWQSESEPVQQQQHSEKRNRKRR